MAPESQLSYHTQNVEDLCSAITTHETANQARFLLIAVMGRSIHLDMLINSMSGKLRSKKEMCAYLRNIMYNENFTHEKAKQVAIMHKNIALVTAMSGRGGALGEKNRRRNLKQFVAAEYAAQQVPVPRFVININYAQASLYHASRHEYKLARDDLPVFTGDYNFDSLCAYGYQNRLSLSTFRKYVLTNPKRFFQGKHLKIAHLFRPNGSPRSTIQEICWAIRTIGSQRFWGLFGT